jgi:hypothetical protein
VQRLASRLWPRGPHPGDLGWAIAIAHLANRVVLAVGALTIWFLPHRTPRSVSRLSSEDAPTPDAL